MTTTARNAATGTGMRLNGSKPGEIRRALRRSLEEARQAGREPEPLVAALAERLAGVADAAWRADDHRSFMAAADKLSRMLPRLGIVTGLTVPIGGEEGDDDGDRVDPIDAELAELVGSGPTIRDAADS